MSRRIFSLLLWLALAGAAPAFAASAGHDLGQGLVYIRVHHLPADLPANPEGRAPATVVDLRYVEADAATTTALGAWLKFRAGPKSPVLVLVNSKTSPALLATLRAHDPKSGILLISGSAGAVRPDLTVPTSAEAERKAYDAFETGTPLATLITDFPDKVRIDEASLNFERPAPEVTDTDDQPQPAPVIDAALQRAVHLHRTLLALKRI
jgi:nucleoside phosphorylase